MRCEKSATVTPLSAVPSTLREQLGLRRGKGPITAVPRACAVRRYDPKMVSGAGGQAGEVGTNSLVRVSDPTLHHGSVPVTGRRAILEIKSRGQPMRID